MSGLVILLLIIIVLVAVFSVQNAAPVAVSFLMWKFEASLAIVIFFSLISGVIIGAVLVFLGRLRGHSRKTESPGS